MSPLPGSVLGKTSRERSLWKGLLERTRGLGHFMKRKSCRFCPEKGNGEVERMQEPQRPQVRKGTLASPALPGTWPWVWDRAAWVWLLYSSS